MSATDHAPVSPDALVERLFGATIAAMDLFGVYLGDRLDYYRALSEGGPATSGELAKRTGTADSHKPAKHFSVFTSGPAFANSNCRE